MKKRSTNHADTGGEALAQEVKDVDSSIEIPLPVDKVYNAHIGPIVTSHMEIQNHANIKSIVKIPHAHLLIF